MFVSLIDDLIFDTLRGPIRMQSGELISSWPLAATTYQSSHSLLFWLNKKFSNQNLHYRFLPAA